MRINADSLKPTPYWKYFLRSLIILLILAMIIAMMYMFLNNSDQNFLHGVLIAIGIVSAIIYLGYWIYIVIHETALRKGLSYGTSKENELKAKRIAILKAHKAQAKARGETLSKEEIESINSGKYDNEV